jgi:KaiC/GvpD/RAD55 family RecA-like ATPase
MQDAPTWWLDLLEKKRSEPANTNPADYQLTEGGRNNRLTQKAGHMRRAGFDTPAIAAALHDYNGRHCNPPLDREEVDQIAESVGSYDTIEDVYLDAVANFVALREAQRVKFQLLTLGEFSLEEPEQIVRGMLEPDSLCMVYGPSGVGKSFFTLDLALSIACGVPYHGREVKQGPVVYLAGEGHRGIVKRSLAWGIDRGQNVTKSKFYLARRPFDLMSVESTTSVIEAIETILEGNAPSVVVVDTLARNFGDGDENATKDMNQVIRMLDDVRIRFPGVCIILVHHSGHSGERARGSSVLRAAMDFEYQVLGEDGRIEVLNTKMKDGTPPAPMAFELVDVELGGVDFYGEPVKSAFCRSTEAESEKSRRQAFGQNQQAAINLLKIMTVRGDVNFDQWLAEYKTKQKEDPKPRRTLDRLIESGDITKDNGFVRVLINL